jgi:hypothetical protein
MADEGLREAVARVIWGAQHVRTKPTEEGVELLPPHVSHEEARGMADAAIAAVREHDAAMAEGDARWNARMGRE